MSVGIDIGTTTTQVIFSRIRIENTASVFAVPRVGIVEQEIVYRGEVHFTPLLSDAVIDAEALSRLMSHEFSQAGFSHGDPKTGAVIITGEAARKENARDVQQAISWYAGEFVVATAGPDLESLIAGKGSGACRHSEKYGCVVANLDIGGGTTNIAVFDSGKAVHTGCLNIGGRLIKIDNMGIVTYVSKYLKPILNEFDIAVSVGKHADEVTLTRIAEAMNNALEQAMGLRKKTRLFDMMVTAGSSALPDAMDIDCVCFSGGVADCFVPCEDRFKFGDIGIFLGEAIAGGGIMRRFKIIRPEETIRSTVIGAGCHTLSVTGSTITYARDVLPLKNLPVLCFSPEEERDIAGGDSDALSRRMRWFMEQSSTENMVLYFRTIQNPRYVTVKRLGEIIAKGAGGVLAQKEPVLVASRHDMAKALGQQIGGKTSGGRSIVCIDGIDAVQGDYLDIGGPLLDGQALQVVVKTLLYG